MPVSIVERLKGVTADIDFRLSKNQELIDLNNHILDLANVEILVGVPEEKAIRPDDEQGINNAMLVAIHTKGSPLQGLPPRPIIEPALEASGNKEKIEEDLKQILDAIFDNNPQLVKRLMHVTGQDAVNIVRDWFDDPRNNWPPDLPATVKAKLTKRGWSKKKVQKALTKYAEGDTSINQTLIDTSEMRNAITYVLMQGSQRTLGKR